MDYRRQAQRDDSRQTIGLLTTWLIELHQLQWLGAVDAARAHQVNLISFAGRQLEHPDNFYAQANVIFDLVNPEQIDGLIIWASTLQAFVGRQKMEEFCQQYQPMPMVSIEQTMAGLPSLLVDNRQGMNQAVSHLIEVHGYRRIAFIRGPANHSGAQERYQGYLEALAQHGLPLDPDLVTSPPLHWLPAEARARVSRLLDKQSAKVEAIVAANDDLVLGVLMALQARRIRVPGDIAVVGFDNWMNIDRPDFGLDDTPDDPTTADLERVLNIRATMLPLTTVRSPFYETGWQSVELILTRLRGEPVPEIVTMPTELIVRRSCGCFSGAVRQTGSEPIIIKFSERPVGETFTEAIIAQQEQIMAHLKQLLTTHTADDLEPDWAERLITAFISQVRNESANAFLSTLDEMVRATLKTRDGLDSWWRVLFGLRRQTWPYLMTDEAKSRAEALWQQVHWLMSEVAERFYTYHQSLAEKRDQTLREIGQKLITTLDIDQLAQIMDQELPTLGIKSCYLALYKTEQRDDIEPGPERGEIEYPTKWSRSILVYENGQRIALTTGKANFPSRQLAPGDGLPRKQPYSLVVESLYFKDQQLGFAVFEMGPREGWVYEMLRGQLSSALEGALLVEQMQDKNRLLHQEISQRQQVEAALQKAHNELEHRVTERTAELAQANKVLKEQIVERQRAEEMGSKLEAQLRQAQKMEAIGQLAGGIAHDFNNLLVVIIGYSNLLLSHLETGEPARKDVEQIREAGERAATLTRQLLTFSRRQILQPRVLNLNSVITNVETMLRRLIGEDIELITLLDSTLTPVIADPGQIEQIIVNLGVNARDAMPQGGKLTIETANVYLNEDFARQNFGVEAGSYVMLRVSDTGIGMDLFTRAHLFEPFFTTKPQGKGTGLGLATVFGIVQQSDGHIIVSSEPGQGTTFKIYLPQSKQGVGEVKPEKVFSKPRFHGSETILLVEDDPGVRVATRRFLEEHGYTVLEAHHGFEALHLCHQHAGPIHLLITDVVMPGMSGRELVERMVTIRPHIAVLYISGYTDSTMLHHGVSETTITLLQKPFTADALVRKVREVLDMI